MVKNGNQDAIAPITVSGRGDLITISANTPLAFGGIAESEEISPAGL